MFVLHQVQQADQTHHTHVLQGQEVGRKTGSGEEGRKCLGREEVRREELIKGGWAWREDNTFENGVN